MPKNETKVDFDIPWFEMPDNSEIGGQHNEFTMRIDKMVTKETLEYVHCINEFNRKFKEMSSLPSKFRLPSRFWMDQVLCSAQREYHYCGFEFDFKSIEEEGKFWKEVTISRK